MLNQGMLSSKTDLWATPQDFFDTLNTEFHFDIDVCALPENAKCGQYFTPQDDGLRMAWHGVCFMNPPYGRTIGQWIEKAWREVQSGRADKVVCLLPARTDTKWFQNYCLKSSDIRFLRGRLKFGGSKHGAPFPSVIVVFSKDTLKGNKQHDTHYIRASR